MTDTWQKPAFDHQQSALLVVTSHTELGDTGQKTGFWFEELATPFWGFYDAGYAVTIASIQGGKATPDPLSTEKEYISESATRFLASKFAMDMLDRTLCIDDISCRGFTTMFLCGGHGTLWDFSQSKGLARVVSEFYAAGKLIGAVCHGPTGLLSARKSNGEALVKGLKLTSFTDAEEKLVPEAYIQATPYHLEDALRREQAEFTAGKPGSRYVAVEKGLITGQNPQSSSLVTQTVLNALEKKSVWIDTNMSIGVHSPSKALCNVDDAFGVLHLFNAVSVKVAGISTVFGNSDVETALAQTRDLVNRFGPIGLPVVKGAATAMDVRQVIATDATKSLARALEAKRLTLVALGPATNIASFVLLHPELVPRIDQVILPAGRSRESSHFIAGPRQDSPFSDLNFDMDPDAVRILLDSDIPLVLIPFETAHNVWISQKELDILGSHPGVGTFLEEYSRPWHDHWVESYGAKGFNLFGALAAGFAANPNLFNVSRVPARIKLCPDDTRPGRFGEPESYKPCLLASDQCISPKTVLFSHDVAQEFVRDTINCIVNPKDMSKLVSAVSHLNVIVDDLDEATAFYRRTLGFEPAYNEDGKMDYPNLTLSSFAKDAGFLDGKVNVDIRFLHHPVVGLYLELMRYHYPKGNPDITIKNTNDMGGIRHVALEVTDALAAFEYLKEQPGVTMVCYPDKETKDKEIGPPLTLDPFPMAFFYWRDPYGVQWEMESGRERGGLRGI